MVAAALQTGSRVNQWRGRRFKRFSGIHRNVCCWRGNNFVVLQDSTLINLPSLEQLQDHALRQRRLPYLLLSIECWQLRPGGRQDGGVERGEESRDKKIKEVALQVQFEHYSKGRYMACWT